MALAPSVSEAQVAQMLADACHYLAQPDTGIRQTRKELTAKRLQAGPALVLLERLARQGTVLHPDPPALKAWLQSRIPLKNWIPAALEAYRSRSLDPALLQQHLDEADLNAGSGYRRFFDEACEAQHASPEGLADLLAITPLHMRQQWARARFHHPKAHWSDAQVTRLVNSLDASTSERPYGTCDHAKDLWWGAACGGSSLALDLVWGKGWPVAAEYIHNLWEGAARPYGGPQDQDPPLPTDAAFLAKVCEITDRWWRAQDQVTQSDFPRRLLSKAVTGVFYRPAGLHSVSRWILFENRLGQGAFSGLTRSDLAQEIAEVWIGGKYNKTPSLLEGLDQYLVESTERWRADPEGWIARETLIEGIGAERLPRLRAQERQAHLAQCPSSLHPSTRARS